jgi:hypothetical protein
MALKPKHPHICIDERIWDDPVMIGLSPTAFRSYIFGIAWSKSQAGRTMDGFLTNHGLSRIGATPSDIEELEAKSLIEECNNGYYILKYEEWQVTAQEAVQLREEAEQAQLAEDQRQAAIAAQLAEIEASKERQREYGSQGGKKRWQNATPPPIEEGFEVEASFVQAWGEWPDASEARFTENREQALESFRANITNSKDFATFSAALLKRIKDYHGENKPKAERRKFLGAFKNFCDGRWKDWIPKSYQNGNQPIAPAPAAPVPTEPVPASKFPPRSNGLSANVTDEELLAYLEPNPAA